MVEIGSRPLLWHIMKHYAHYDCNEFYVALGYLGEYIKRYFRDYSALMGDMRIDLATGLIQNYEHQIDPWVVNLIDTGTNSNTGGRLHRLRPWLKGETFMLTYGDGLSNVDISALMRFHRSHGRAATVTAVRPPARFGGLVLEDNEVRAFTEKPQTGEGWINGGFMVFEPKVFDYLDSDDDSLEIRALERLADDGQLMSYCHEDFWQCMDTLRDKRTLERHWESGDAPWRIWE
jgi:glucose-1-phosphate cytidylyltransferase